MLFCQTNSTFIFTIMEQDGGAPYYKAKITAKPVLRIDGTVIAKVSFVERQGKTIARFYSDKDKALTLKTGDIVYVCPYDADAYMDEKKNQ